MTLVFVAMTVFLFAPMWLETGTVPGRGGDVYQTLGKFLAHESFSEEGFQAGISWDPFDYVALLIGWVPIDWVYKLSWGLTYVLSGLGMYLLVRHYTQNKNAGVIAGMLYAFSHFHIVRSLGFWGATNQQWIPFFVLFLERGLERKSLWNWLGVLIFGYLILTTDPHYVLAVALFLLVFLAIRWRRIREILHTKRTRYSLLGILFFGIIAGIWMRSDYLSVLISDENYFVLSMDWVLKGSNSVWSLFIPGSFHTLWGPWFTFYGDDRFYLGEINKAYLGVLTIVLMIAGFWHYRHTQQRTRALWIEWTVVFVLFSVLTLGPFLQLVHVTEIPMPYYLLYRALPFLESVRAIDRLFVIAMLAAGVMAGLAYTTATSALPVVRRRILFSAVIAVGLIDAWSWNLPTEPIQYSRYYETLAKDSSVDTILESPSSASYTYASNVIYTSKVHDKKVYNNFDFARKNPKTLLEETTYIPIRSAVFGSYKVDDIVTYDDQATAEHFFWREGIDQLVLSKKNLGLDEDFAASNRYKSTQEYMEIIGASVAYEDEWLVVYDLPQKEHPDVYVFPTRIGFSDPTSILLGDSRSVKDGAVLWLENDSGETKSGFLTCEVQADRNVVLKVYESGQLRSDALVSGGVSKISLPLSDLSHGHHELELRFSRYDEENVPSKIEILELAWSEVPLAPSDFVALESLLSKHTDPGSVVVYPNAVLGRFPSWMNTSEQWNWLSSTSGVDIEDEPVFEELWVTKGSRYRRFRREDIRDVDYYRTIMRQFLNGMNIEWIALDPRFTTTLGKSRFAELVKDLGGSTQATTDAWVLFDLQDVSSDSKYLPLVVLESGWGALEDDDAYVYRTIRKQAEFRVAYPELLDVGSPYELIATIRLDAEGPPIDFPITVDQELWDTVHLESGKETTLRVPLTPERTHKNIGWRDTVVALGDLSKDHGDRIHVSGVKIAPRDPNTSQE